MSAIKNAFAYVAECLKLAFEQLTGCSAKGYITDFTDFRRYAYIGKLRGRIELLSVATHVAAFPHGMMVTCPVYSEPRFLYTLEIGDKRIRWNLSMKQYHALVDSLDDQQRTYLQVYDPFPV